MCLLHQVAVIELGKDIVRTTIVETLSGKKVTFQDARKSAK